MQIQKRQEINRTYGLSRSNSFVGEIPDEEFKVFMAIARCALHSGPYISLSLRFCINACFASNFTAKQSWKIF